MKASTIINRFYIHMLLHFSGEEHLRETVTDMVLKMNAEDMESLILKYIKPKDNYDSFQLNDKVIRDFRRYHDEYYNTKN